MRGGPHWHHRRHRPHRPRGPRGPFGPFGPFGHSAHRGAHGGPWRHHHRRASLRRRLTAAFAVVALGAVALTTWLTTNAVADVQRSLFQTSRSSGAIGGEDPAGPRGTDLDPATVEAFGRVTRTAFRAAALAFVFAVFAAGAFTNVLTRPLHALTRGARRLEAGERGIRLTVPAGRDELGSLTEAFNALVEGLERQEAWRRDMTADIAHDLRTPLAVLRSEIEGMQDGVVPTDPAGLQRLHREVMLLARLVDDLRVLSVSDGGGLSLQRAAVDVEPLLRRSLDAFGSRASEAGAELVLLPIEQGLRADIDADRISQVVGNLLDNALRHAGAVRIEVGAEASTSWGGGGSEETGDGPTPEQPGERRAVRVWVRDHGPGLPPAAVDQVFERFYRADSARSRATDEDREVGSGLGLAIARAIVNEHGGGIVARNHEGGGAEFEFFLPAAV